MTTTRPDGSGRKPLGKRVRFEVFKRDKFRCRYCGATPDQAFLHVDHVIPVAQGGSDEIINLVTSCQPCNSGKSSRPLGDLVSSIVEVPDSAQLKEQADQIRAYLAAKRLADKAMEAVADYFHESWEDQIGPMSEDMFKRLKRLASEVDHQLILEAIRITGNSRLVSVGSEFSWYKAWNQRRYFSAVLKNLRTGDTSWKRRGMV